MKPEIEHELEFVRRAAGLSCRAFKFEPDGENGWPDRLILCPGPHTFFIEFKRSKNHEPEKKQLHKHKLLRAMGYTVYVAWSPDQAMEYLLYELSKRDT